MYVYDLLGVRLCHESFYEEECTLPLTSCADSEGLFVEHGV